MDAKYWPGLVPTKPFFFFCPSVTNSNPFVATTRGFSASKCMHIGDWGTVLPVMWVVSGGKMTETDTVGMTSTPILTWEHRRGQPFAVHDVVLRSERARQ